LLYILRLNNNGGRLSITFYKKAANDRYFCPNLLTVPFFLSMDRFFHQANRRADQLSAALLLLSERGHF